MSIYKLERLNHCMPTVFEHKIQCLLKLQQLTPGQNCNMVYFYGLAYGFYFQKFPRKVVDGAALKLLLN